MSYLSPGIETDILRRVCVGVAAVGVVVGLSMLLAPCRSFRSEFIHNQSVVAVDARLSLLTDCLCLGLTVRLDDLPDFDHPLRSDRADWSPDMDAETEPSRWTRLTGFAMLFAGVSTQAILLACDVSVFSERFACGCR